jgi:DNA segregation ATPase FtsK/SpoIIIE-like protein
MTTQVEFTRLLIKGKIAETIFEQMLREMNEYTIIPFGYEHTVPTLAQYQHIAKVKQVMENIKDAPDFALVSEDKKKVHLVEVKYQATLAHDFLCEYARNLHSRWDPSWIFVATLGGFYFSPCSSIANSAGQISPLTDTWVNHTIQTEYLKLLNEFENPYNKPDVLLPKAIELLNDKDTISASIIQKHLSVGYARAARLMDELCEAGYVGEADGIKPRQIIKHT